MQQKVFSMNDLVINHEGLIGPQSIISALDGGWGLAPVSAVMQSRHNAWPIYSTTTREARSLILTSLLLTSDNILRDALLWEFGHDDINRLVMGDSIPPSDLILMFGPWDSYTDSDVWYCYDIFREYSGTVTGAIHAKSGQQEHQRAIVIEVGSTNYVANPSFEKSVVDSWTLANGARAQSTAYKYNGLYSLALTAGAGSDSTMRSNTAALPNGQSVTVQCMAYRTNAHEGRLYVYDLTHGSVVGTYDATTEMNNWEYLQTSWLNNTGGAVNVAVFLVNRAQDGTTVIYFDSIQMETNQNFATSYLDGGLGRGYTWSGIPHNSSSTRATTEFNIDSSVGLLNGNPTFSIRCVIQAPYADTATWPVNYPYVWCIYTDANNRVELILDTIGANNFYLHVEQGGIDQYTYAIGAFAAGDWIDVMCVLDFDGDIYQIYQNGNLCNTSTGAYNTPNGITQWNIGTNQVGANHGGWAFAEYSVFDRALSGDEVLGLYNQQAGLYQGRYFNVATEAIQPITIGGIPSKGGFVSSLIVDEDARLRSMDVDIHFEQIFANTKAFPITVDSDDVVYPVIRMTPISVKSAGWPYRRWITVRWNTNIAATKYPVDITNGGLDTQIASTNFAQADGDDLRVWVDGVEVDRWLNGINTATTDVWCNLDFEPDVSMTLKTAIGAAGDIDVIAVNEDIGAMPSNGILQIDNEIFTFTSKSVSKREFYGIARAQRGTASGAHAISANVRWIQHDIWILYGNATCSGPSVDNNYAPIMTLAASNNITWTYADFGEEDGLRTGQWNYSGLYTKYTANHGGNIDPWAETGITGTGAVATTSKWILYNPCGILNANFSAGEKYSNNKANWKGFIESSNDGSSWNIEFTIPIPAADGVWEAWTDNEAVASQKYVAMTFGITAWVGSPTHMIENSACAITVDLEPTVTIGAEQSNYSLNITLSNGVDELRVSLTIGLGQTVEIDTYDKTAITTFDGQSCLDAIELVGGPRKDWFRLLPGTNNVTASDTNTTQLNTSFRWERRLFE